MIIAFNGLDEKTQIELLVNVKLLFMNALHHAELPGFKAIFKTNSIHFFFTYLQIIFTNNFMYL